jgi:hypothetical protein
MADVKSRIFDLGLCAALLAGVLTPAVAAAGEPDLRLQIASYNLQFVMPELPFPGNLVRDLPGQKPNVELRARAIGAALACFDVIALQETINDRAGPSCSISWKPTAATAASRRGCARGGCSRPLPDPACRTAPCCRCSMTN